MNKHWTEFDEVFSSFNSFLKHFTESSILQNFFILAFSSIIYATIIRHFFQKLNQKNVIAQNLPKGNLEKIRDKFKDIRKKANQASSKPLKGIIIDKQSYINFKQELKKDFPEFLILFKQIEKDIEFGKLQKYIKNKEKQISKARKKSKNWNDLLITSTLEAYVKKTNSIPISQLSIREYKRIYKMITQEFLSSFSKNVKKTLDSEKKNMLNLQRHEQKDFERVIYTRWEEPIDLLECLIKISLECGQDIKEQLNEEYIANNTFKVEAIFKIHARALQISNEILVLLKSGYPDGAYARWRSLHELEVIGLFLKDNANEVSERYLLHEVIRKFKEAKDFRANYKKLGYVPLSRKDYNAIKREKERLCILYPDNFHTDYGWIPTTILADRNFRKMEEHVKLKKTRPFYNLSCDSVHGGSKGFYRLGLLPESQDEMFLIGPSDYGLAEPIQNCAISLYHITSCILFLKRDLKNITSMIVFQHYLEELCKKVKKIHNTITKKIYSKRQRMMDKEKNQQV